MDIPTQIGPLNAIDSDQVTQYSQRYSLVRISIYPKYVNKSRIFDYIISKKEHDPHYISVKRVSCYVNIFVLT